ncbi:hypothetical protein GH714_011223 [Hevea brasiliensis]|uniref:ABC transporter domain-containing protein n=1 Tax=Hevea brasiliensis TaxID=3981 RepID=A0A6A6MY39_HEVBR|nr:hypothetical protein GH714_011223 [Hevea brasiliensis]
MSSTPFPHAPQPAFLTLGQLLKRVGDVRKEATGDGNETPIHQVLELDDTNSDVPSSIPFILSFNNLTYSVKVRQKMKLPGIINQRRHHHLGPGTVADPVAGESMFTTTKTLLNDISGEARDGEILAVLGASGSGKSTLIDALANRISKESLKGTITLNDEVLGSRMLKVISAYVMQDDLLFPMLTVEETLMFAAEFRLPRSLSKSKKKMRVQALIDQLGLRNAAKTVIGDEGFAKDSTDREYSDNVRTPAELSDSWFARSVDISIPWPNRLQWTSDAFAVVLRGVRASDTGKQEQDRVRIGPHSGARRVSRRDEKLGGVQQIMAEHEAYSKY